MDVGVNLEGSIYNVCDHVCYIWAKVSSSEMPFQNGLENSLHGVVIKVCESDYVEMSLESWGDERFTTTWCSHSSNDHCINDVSKWMLIVFSIIPSTLILKLSKNFNWWLRLQENLWHVKIIDEDNTLHTESWTEMVFSSFVEFHVHDILNLVAMSLSRESYFNDQPFLGWELLEEDILDVGSLTGTCWSNEERWNRVHDE